jgi:hypothetical protein
VFDPEMSKTTFEKPETIIEVRCSDHLRTFVDSQLFEQIKAKLDEYDSLIERFCQLMPEDGWDDALDRMAAAIDFDYVGGDDV